MITDVEAEWSRLRNLLRFAILCGDVVEDGHDWQAWGPGGISDGQVRGIDNGRRTEYADLLRSLISLRAQYPLGHELLRRHVGYHCEATRCRPNDTEWPTIGHWHTISLADLRSRYGQKEDWLKEKRAEAMRYVVQICVES